MTVTSPGPGKHLPNTSWTLLARMRGGDADAEAAREDFAFRYYAPVQAYMRALRAAFHLEIEPEDLAQGFFADVIVGGRLLNRYTRSTGTFRPYLKQALRNYVVSLARERMRKKRHANDEVRPDQWTGGWERLELGVVPEAESAFHESYVRTVLQEAFERTRKVCDSRSLSQHFALFEARYAIESAEPPSWAELGARFGLDGKQARRCTETAAYQFRIALREWFTEEVGSEQVTDEEIATLLSLF